MSRLDFMVYEDSKVCLAFGQSLSEDQAAELAAGSDERIFDHITVEFPDDSSAGLFLDALIAMHNLDNRNGLEEFLTVFYWEAVKGGAK
ncbi:MAG: hypothetical protein V1846_03160 [Candidatus Komeilibacteria bacterium]